VFHIAAHHDVPPPFAETELHKVMRPHPSSAHAQIVQTKQVVHIEDVTATRPYREGDASVTAIADLGGARTIMVVPMVKEDELVGTMAIYRQEVRPFTDKQIDLASNFSRQAVIAVENPRLLNELRQRTGDVTESREQQTATSEVLKVISSSPGALGPVFRAMLDHATRICEANYGILYRYDGTAFHADALLNVPGPFEEELRRG